ncbi:MAG: DUF3108 domain-containing protein, partial [Deltaproteobacteria bacterium]|nr:DUF3108 domain-containing protein [Deltaproteobacteria bacterium]
MKFRICIAMGFALILIGYSVVLGQNRTAASPEGEKASFGKKRFSYGVNKYGLRILEAIITLEETQSEAGERVYLAQAQVRTTGVTSWFFRMHNRFYSWVDARHFGSLRYVKEINQEGIFSGEKNYRCVLTFNQE